MSITQSQEVFIPKYLSLQDTLNEHERAHWLADEADMRSDVEQWKSGKISESEKGFIKMILRLFTQADTDVANSYVTRLLPLFQAPDARMLLLSFANREVTHQLGYKRLNDTLGYDSEEFMTEFLSFKEMKDKHDFMMEDADLSTKAGVATYLAKQVLMEGVNLFAPFAMLLSFSQEGKLPGMVSVNKWSITDESLHVQGLSDIYRIYLNENPEIINNYFKAAIYELARRVVAMEDRFIDLCFSAGSTTSCTPDAVKAYVRYVCDYRMQQLGLKAQFDIKHNPLPWIDYITGNTFGNFFEVTSVEYSKGSLTGEWVY
jgi:ribonucleoside-diphosphate reductase beta chain